MANREFGMIWAAMWDDKGFRLLSRSAQCTYVQIRTQTTVTPCGVTPLQLRWWSQGQADLTPQQLENDIAELDLSGFTLGDFDTEELLLRHFIRTDGVYRKPNSFTSACRTAVKVRSHDIKAALHAEMRTLVAGMIQPVVTPEVIHLATALIGQLDTYAIPSSTQAETFPVPISKGWGIVAGTPGVAIGDDSRHHAVTPGIKSVVATGTTGGDVRPKTEDLRLDTPAASPPGGDLPERPDVEQLCQVLRDCLLANRVRSDKCKVTREWRDQARLLLDKDGVSLADALGLVRWATSDMFWKRNILSMPTFRKQWDRLRLAADSEAPGRRPGAAVDTGADVRL